MSQAFTIGAPADQWPGGAKTMEETAELVNVLAQLIAFPDGHRADGKDLLAALHDEIADAQAALGAFVQLNADRLDMTYIRTRRTRKLERYLAWHASLIDVPVPTEDDHVRTMNAAP